MALPFILGVAVGAGAVLAYNKSDKIKEKANELFDKSKDFGDDIKKSVEGTVDCIKEKVEKKDEEKKEEEHAK